MAYYGILMKDGTELTHYGVKGMKWGKRLFGKVKGVFGKPTVSARNNGLSKEAKSALAAKQARLRQQMVTNRILMNPYTGDKRVDYALDHLSSFQDYKKEKQAEYGAENKKIGKVRKRYSQRLNGR